MNRAASQDEPRRVEIVDAHIDKDTAARRQVVGGLRIGVAQRRAQERRRAE
jgi:hypothetical protein